MKRILIGIAVLSVLVAPTAYAGPARGEPPGLAKKPYGLPPGQAKKMWRKGERLPSNYIAPQYFVAEPQVYHLAPPPRGYRWVVVEGDAYLVQTTNGMIADVIADAVADLIRR